VQLPHEVTARLVPQLSGAVTLPQSLPMRVQKAPVVSGVQQTEALPQTSGALQFPHEATVRLTAQLS
jgi:hypothetical protein